MHKICSFILLLLLSILNLTGQPKFKVPKEPTIVAEEMATKYSSDENKIEMVSLLSVTEFDFRYTRKDETQDAFHTNAEQKELHHFIALEDKVSSYIIESYDEESEIGNFKLYEGNALRKPGSMSRKCYDNISEGILSSDLKICQFQFDFESKGDMVKTDVEKIFKNVRYFTSVYFRSHFPIEKREIVFKVPEWLELDFHEINFEDYDIVMESKEITTGEKYTEYRYTVNGLKGRPKADFMPGATHFEPHIAINIKRINHSKNSKALFASNEDVYAWYKELAASCENESEGLESFTEDLIGNVAEEDEKLKAIYYWLQDNIRYIAYEDGIMGFKPEDAKDVFSQKYGDCKGMANLAKTMLIQAGFDARLTWIGTNRIGAAYDYSFPSLANDNHMICTVIRNGEQIYIDPTETFIKLGDYADRIQGRKMMIEDGDNYIIATVPEADISRNRVEKKWNLSIEDELLKGHVKSFYNGDRKVSIMNDYSYTKSHNKEEALKDFLERNDKNIKADNCTSEGLENREVPASFEFDVVLDNSILNVNNDLYLSLEMDRNFSETDVILPREMDIYFGQKIHNSMEVILEVPKGYDVDYLPAPLSINKDGFEFEGSYVHNGSNIIYSREIIISRGKVGKALAKDWNESIRLLNELYDDQIVLSRQK